MSGTIARVLPDHVDARRVIGLRGLRGFVDGAASVVLPTYLALLGLSTARVGAIATITMLGSAMATLTVAWVGRRWLRRHVLVGASVLMILTGCGFALGRTFWLLVVVAFLGTLNPSSGDVSVFQPVEHALLPQTAPDRDRTRLFARYSLVGSLLGAFGSLSVGLVAAIHHRGWTSEIAALRIPFWLYTAVGVVSLVAYLRLSPEIEPTIGGEPGALGESRGIVLRLAALFSLDSFASGFTVQAMLALWLSLRFDLSVAVSGVVFFWTSLFTAASMLVSPWLADRIGLVRTMVFTHIPANLFLMAAALMPNAWLAVGCLLARSVFATMDVPARTSYVMAVVPPERRSAASAITNVPRSLAAAAGPAMSGALLARTTFGWPLIIAGSLKIVYDLELLRSFGSIRPPEEQA
ncbi:MAG: MFS transporter [Acidimicrobiales bacterium]